MNTKYSQEFYYASRQEELSYSSSGSKLSILQILRGSANIWEQNVPLLVFKPKVLIFNDWTAATYAPKEAQIVIDKLKQAITDGFTIYFIQNEHLVNAESVINSPTFSFIDYCIVRSINDIQALAATIVPIDQQFILDDYWVQQLGNNTFVLPERALDLYAYNRLSNTERIILENYWKNCFPPLSVLIKPGSWYGEYQKFKEINSKNVIIIEYKTNLPNTTINIKSDYIKELCLSHISDFHNLYVLADYFRQLTFIDLIDCNLSTSIIDTLLIQSSNVRDFTLMSCNFLEQQAFVLPENSLPQLIRLDFSHTNISLNNFIILLKAAPNIKEINLNDFGFLSDHNVSFELEALLRLDSILFENAKFQRNHLFNIINAAPNMCFINLLDCTILESNEFSVPINTSVSKVEQILFDSTKCETKTLNDLLVAFGGINSLLLQNSNILSSSSLDLAENSLKQLQEINLDNTQISLDNLNVLMRAAPQCAEEINKKIRQIELSIEKQIIAEKVIQQTQGLAPIASNNTSEEKSNQSTRQIATTLNNNSSAPVIFNAVNPSYSHTSMLDFVMKTDFAYKKLYTRNQDMIIAQLSQYLVLSGKYPQLIPAIQDGICSTLSDYFSSMSFSEWDKFIDLCLAWDGQSEISPNLEDHLTHLITLIITGSSGLYRCFYLGDDVNLHALLLQKTSIKISNMVHQIVIKKDETNKIFIYDPSDVNGYKESVDLNKEVVRSLGTIISLDNFENNVFNDIVINNPGDFIERSGLLMLCQVHNSEQILQVIQDYPNYSRQNLYGLLLRNTSAKPGWIVGLSHANPKIQEFTRKLLKLFISYNQENAVYLLKKSMSGMQQEMKLSSTDLIVELCRLFDYKNNVQIRHFISDLHVETREKDYVKLLKPTQHEFAADLNILQYCQHCLAKQSGYYKRLIELDSTEKVQTLKLKLQELASRPVFYIEKAEDLICASTYIKSVDDINGEMQRGPGGKLYDFLQQNQDTSPIFIIDYTKWPAEDLIAFNTLLDKVPSIQEIPLPNNTSIIGIRNINTPDCYSGADLYSRFNHCDKLPPCVAQLDYSMPWQKFSLEELNNQVTIDLFNSIDWKSLLCGRWMLYGQVLQYKSGALESVDVNTQCIVLKNAPWNLSSFQYFWMQLKSHNGVIYNNKTFNISKNILILQGNDGYDWDNLKLRIHNLVDSDNEDPHILNPTCLNNFFEQYVIQDDGLYTTAGILESSASALINVYLTNSLSVDEWAKLLNKCQDLNKYLRVQRAPNIKLVPELESLEISESQLLGAKDEIIVSQDLDLAVLYNNYAGSVVLNISECNSDSLLQRVKVKIAENQCGFECTQTNAALINLLAQDKHVILVGIFSQELEDKLSEYLLFRNELSKGKITIITNQIDIFQGMKTRIINPVYEKMSLFSFEVRDKLQEFSHEPLRKLRARRDYLELYPNSLFSDAALQGLSYIAGIEHNSEGYDLSNNADRKLIVNRILNREGPQHVFISGLSGVGKSTFVKNVLCEAATDVLYIGDSQIQQWLEDSSSKRKILFLDEANLGNKQWSEFEGLYYTPPSLLFNGEVYPLSGQHKVIFAGNPASYSNERHIAPFFEHGHVVVFPPLSTDLIYEDILNRTWSTEEYKNNTDINIKILNVYQEICARSQTEVLISPRELEMIVLLIEVKMRSDIGLNIFRVTSDVIAEFKARALSEPLVPKANEPSRKPLQDQLNALLDLRIHRRLYRDTLNDKQLYGGLGGIIIEGEPGIGKSQLVMDTLVAHNLKKNKDFYLMPVNLSLEEKKQLLLKAFHAGLIVVIDEINSSAMMENYLNALLMGKTLEGESPQNPGFMIIGTQNPITMSGRRAMSTALKRRLLCTTVTDYPELELLEIIESKGIERSQAINILAVYNQMREMQYKPTFRDLMEKVVDPIVRVVELNNEEEFHCSVKLSR